MKLFDKFRTKLFFVLIIGLILPGILLTPAIAQNGQTVTVRIAPEDTQVIPGDTVDVAVEVVNAVDLYAIDVLLEYDPQAVEVLDMDEELPGIQVSIGTFLEPGFVILNLVDNEMGRLRLAMTQLNPATPKTGTGAIVVVKFKGKALSAPTALTLINVKLATPYGTELTVNEIEDGTIEVVQQIVGPTPTEIPAQDPGTPMPTQALPTAAPTATGTQASSVLEPTATATLNYLVIPPTPTITPTPTQTPIPTQTPLPTQVPPATQTPVASGMTVEETQAGGTVVSTATEKAGGIFKRVSQGSEKEEKSGSSLLLWILVPIGVLVIAGLGYFLIRRRAERNLQEH